MNRTTQKSLATRARHLVWTQYRMQVADGEGGHTDGWVNRAQVWAAISPIQARQQTQYKTVGVDATHLINVGGYVTIEEKDRFLFGTRVFEVLTVENLQEASFEKVCTCKERR